MATKRTDVRKLAGMALLTAIVVILQLLGAFVRFGPFSISLVLIPIVVGAALYGAGAGAWFGFVFGLVVLLSGDASLFLVINPLGTVLTVLLKGALAGLFAGLVYRAVSGKKSITAASAEAAAADVTAPAKTSSSRMYLAVLLAAIVCPVVNTGIFLIGCRLFFFQTISEWAAGLGFESVGRYMILGLVGGNFLFELIFNIVLSPVIVRLLRIRRNTQAS